MKQYCIILLLICQTVLVTQATHAQQYRWLTGGGSDLILNNGVAQGEWVTHMCTDDNGNVYTLAHVGVSGKQRCTGVLINPA